MPAACLKIVATRHADVYEDGARFARNDGAVFVLSRKGADWCVFDGPNGELLAFGSKVFALKHIAELLEAT